MIDPPSLLISFDEAWSPTVFINGATDEVTAKLKEIAWRILGNIDNPERSEK